MTSRNIHRALRTVRIVTLVASVAAVLGLGSCQDPTGLGGRVQVENPQPVTVPADSLSVVSVEATDSPEASERTFGIVLPSSAKDTATFLCRVDTSARIPRLTLHTTFVPASTTVDHDSYAMQRLQLRLDSLPVDGEDVVSLTHGEVRAVILAYKRVNGRITSTLDTVSVTTDDPPVSVLLLPTVVSGSRTLRLSFSAAVPSITTLDGKRRLARLQAVVKVRY